MARVDRFGVSMDTELLAAFDGFISSRGYRNRSEAIRDLVRDTLLQDQWESSSDAMAVLTFVWDTRVRGLLRRIRDVLLSGGSAVLGSIKIPVDATRDLEAVLLRGPPRTLRSLADRIRACKGVTLEPSRLLCIPVTSPTLVKKPDSTVTEQ